MDILLKAAACVLISVILCNAIPKDRKELSLLLGIAVCCMVSIAALTYLKPVFAFVERLQALGDLNQDMLSVLLKAVGVGIIAEISTLICQDVGNGAMGKSLQLLATAVILWLALPIFNDFITLIEDVLGAI